MEDSVEIPTPNSGFFDDDKLDIRLAKWLRQRSTTRNCKIGAQNVFIPFSVVGHCRNCPGSDSSSWEWSKNSRFGVEIVDLSVIVPEM